MRGPDGVASIWLPLSYAFKVLSCAVISLSATVESLRVVVIIEYAPSSSTVSDA